MGIFLALLLLLGFLCCLGGFFKMNPRDKDIGWLGASLFILGFIILYWSPILQYHR